MKPEELEEHLHEGRFYHLSEAELDAYHEHKLDLIVQERAEAHLKICQICKSRYQLIQEEYMALENSDRTAEEIALVKRLVQKLGFQGGAGKSEKTTRRTTLTERLTVYLQEMVENWQEAFSPLGMVRNNAEGDKPIWQWESPDGVLKVHAIFEQNTDLSLHFFADDMQLEGAQLKIQLGMVSHQISLQRLSETKLYAKVIFPRNQRPRNLALLSIESDG
jgi:hypothetical protein